MRKACFREAAKSEKAVLVYPPEAPLKEFWVPRSVLKHRSMLEAAEGKRHALVQIEVEDWWVGKNPHLDKYFS